MQRKVMIEEKGIRKKKKKIKRKRTGKGKRKRKNFDFLIPISCNPVS